MRYWQILFIALLIPTCAKPADSPVNSIVPSTNPPYVRYLVNPDMSTPDASEETIPALSEYVIRTRVVIEYAVFKKNKDELITMCAVTPKEIYEEFEESEKVFTDLHLRFEISEIIFRKYETGISQFFLDAMKYPDTMSVYYLLPHVFPYAGLSSAPWETFSQGILLSAGRSELTLAHEIGHYFGLLHSFHDGGDDFCEDTLPQSNTICEDVEPNCEPNCGNVMNYCVHDARHVTKDQLDRMQRFLRTKRSNHINMNSDKERADIEAMYNQVVEISVHNYEDKPNEPPSINPNPPTPEDHH